MTGINNGYDRWLTTPPDEEETPICEECGLDMDEVGDDRSCKNVYCPSKFTEGTTEHKMAEIIADQRETIDDLKIKLRIKEHHAQQFLGEINELKAIVKDLTQSQPEKCEVDGCSNFGTVTGWYPTGAGVSEVRKVCTDHKGRLLGEENDKPQ